MGDHVIGTAMGRAARLYWQTRGDQPRPSQNEALSVLDEICGPYRKRDAEFESEDPANPTRTHPDYDRFTDPEGPLGRLIAIAFDATPEEMVIETEHACPWLDGPETRFDQRYGFC